MDTRKNRKLGEYQNETKKNMDNPDLNYNGPQDQVYVGQIIQTEDGPEKVIAVDEQGSYVTEVLEQ